MCRGAEATPGLFSASTEPLCGSPQGFARCLTGASCSSAKGRAVAERAALPQQLLLPGDAPGQASLQSPPFTALLHKVATLECFCPSFMHWAE